MHILLNHFNNEKKLKLLDGILADYVIGYENQDHYHESFFEPTGTYTIKCATMPEVLAEKIVENAAKILQNKKQAEKQARHEQELKNAKVKQYVDELFM